MYLEKPLQTYLDDLASSQATPGGGAASALTGAMAAGLACMVARLTLGNAKYIDMHPEIETLLHHAEKQRTRFQELMQEDIEAYGRLSACFKMPRDNTEERDVRTKAIQHHLKEAAEVPCEMIACAIEVVECCRRIAKVGNVQVLSDIATASMLASGAGNGASWMVRANMKAMKDQELVSKLNGILTTALDSIATGSQQVIRIVGERA